MSPPREPPLPPVPRPIEELRNVPISSWTDAETGRYVAFVFEGAAHLAGGFGALTPRHCLAIAARLRRIGHVGSGGPAATLPDPPFRPLPYTCPRCGQRITDGKPCGCGARGNGG